MAIINAIRYFYLHHNLKCFEDFLMDTLWLSKDMVLDYLLIKAYGDMISLNKSLITPQNIELIAYWAFSTTRDINKK